MTAVNNSGHDRTRCEFCRRLAGALNLMRFVAPGVEQALGQSPYWAEQFELYLQDIERAQGIIDGLMEERHEH
jgi:hypothetical protein